MGPPADRPHVRTNRRLFDLSQVLLLLAAVSGAVAASNAGQWDPWELVVLLATLGIALDFVPIPARSLQISATHVVFVLAMALCGRHRP